MKKYIFIKNSNDLNKFYKKLFFYRSFFCLFLKFDTNYAEIKPIINALNIKNKYKRIEYIYNFGVNYLDNYYNNLKPNICEFNCNKCIVQRINNLKYNNGCCRMCIYKSNRGCKTSNLTCKLFYCSRIRDKYKTYDYNNFKIIKCLDLRRQFILKEDYFTSKEDAILDLKIGLLFIITIKIVIRDLLNLARLNNKNRV